jgi:hypothetical protein
MLYLLNGESQRIINAIFELIYGPVDHAVNTAWWISPEKEKEEEEIFLPINHAIFKA